MIKIDRQSKLELSYREAALIELNLLDLDLRYSIVVDINHPKN